MIDAVSSNILVLAQYLNKIKLGSVSEIWIDKNDLEKVNLKVSEITDTKDLISETLEKIEQINDTDRKTYLQEILSSLEFQLSDKKASLGDYFEKCYGHRIKRVTDSELNTIETEIQNLETKISKDRFQVHQEHKVKESNLISKYKQILDNTKQKIPNFLTQIEGSQFTFEVVNNKPWVAFNSHLAPFTSKLSLNADSGLTDLDLLKFSQHEAWGGHHSELSLKDTLLTEQGRGEHGIVIVNSPQVFVSEGIAEGLFRAFGLFDQLSDEQQLLWFYTRKLLALHNLAAHYYFDDGKEKEEISTLLERYNVGKNGIKVVVDFSTDDAFGRYSAVYYSASTFIDNLYNQTKDKEAFLKFIFTQPCTPTLLKEKFSIQK
jgi:hypothetical protein